MKIVVLNDLHPQHSPGAASIAYALAKEASKEFPTEFWCSEIDKVEISDASSIVTRVKRVSVRRARAMESSRPRRLYFEVFGFHELYWLIKQIRISQPTHLWIHQIGNRFPMSVILVSKILKISIITTIHDYGIILNRKIYPSDFGWNATEVDIKLRKLDELKLSLQVKFSFVRLFLDTRRMVVLFLMNLSSEVICISQIEAKILGSVGVRVSQTIPNGVSPCECEVPNSLQNGKFNILFAGRHIGKGLELILQAAAMNPDVHLHLAGGLVLKEIAETKLDRRQFTYHGFLNQLEVNHLIHKVQLVSVLSTCFDVYPTIILEAISHKTPVVTNRITGNYQIVLALSKDLVIPYGEVPDLVSLEKKLLNSDFIYPKILSTSDSWKLYRKFFK